ncbi:cystinosin [Arthroderma uncinatum]|uniref:cystinosin n=1 Tax=Arthroderma uncinatum TaxID=74035 RepID=UPI00144A8B5D|nr:cystinosin [Arthroderma uncinatum]KAF3484143.1 cystinosin [Arthroderma uncinatum]
MLCWSGSFYPQPIKNWRRRSTSGLAIAFPTANVLGFICYAVYTFTFLYSPIIRDQYAARHPAAPEPSVRANDVAFAVHAVILSVTTYTQFFPMIWGFKVSAYQNIGPVVGGIIWGCVLSIFGVFLLAWSKGGNDASDWAWIDVIYTMSYVKLFVTVVKYCPQVYLNYRLKSTVGWSINQILLDLIGGILSLLQLVIDSSLQNDWSGITGNPAKFGLGNVSIFFDLVFIVQHYILYRGRCESSKDNEDVEDPVMQPLLGSTA